VRVFLVRQEIGDSAAGRRRPVSLRDPQLAALIAVRSADGRCKANHPREFAQRSELGARNCAARN